MSTRRLSLPAIGLFLATLSLLSWGAPTLARAEGEDESAQADAYFRQGKALVKRGRFEEAYQAYLAGYRRKQGYDLAGNLGNVELELGKPRDAAEHLAFCLKNFPATGTPKQLEFIKGRFAEARRRVGALSIKVSADGAEVIIDGRSIGRSPFPDEVFVDPGSRVLEAKLGGHQPARKVIEIDKGASAPVELLLTPTAASPPSPPPSPLRPTVAVLQHPAPVRHPVKRSVAPVIAGFSVAVVGVGVGIAGMVASNAAEARARATWSALSSPLQSACLPSHPENQADCDALDHAYQTSGTFRAVSILGFAAGGAAAVATVIYTLMPGERTTPASIQAGVTVAPGGASLGLAGRF